MKKLFIKIIYILYNNEFFKFKWKNKYKKDSFDNLSSFPRKYTIISVLILYIIINLLGEYYITKTSPTTQSPQQKKILTKNELLSSALYILKNIILVILIL